ncbi:unnamed protein product [marine sediment metagenome]|uniref:Uncharacterized protein n=1 Tax=marine sediment metagenome TaxID=412755 RepID=X1BXU0_9ZZZZ
MESELKDVVEIADISLNSEISIIKKISDIAKDQGKIHKIILMIDLGELREGQIEELYTNIFVVKVYEKGKRVSRASFNFADILTGIVKISSINEDDDYFPWLSE